MTTPELEAALGQNGVIALACVAALGSGLLMGLFNGIVIVRFGIPALLTTLGTMMLFAGLGSGLTGGVGITGMPKVYVDAVSAELGGILPYSFLAILAIFVLVSGYVRVSVFGKSLFLYGENKVAAHCSPASGSIASR